MSAGGNTEKFDVRGGGSSGDGGSDDDGGDSNVSTTTSTSGTTSTTPTPGSDPSTADDPFGTRNSDGTFTTFDPDTLTSSGGTGGGSSGGGGGGSSGGGSSGGGSTTDLSGSTEPDPTTGEDGTDEPDRTAERLTGSDDPVFRPDLFRDPAQQVQARERIEQQIRNQRGLGPGAVDLEPGEVEFSGVFENGVLVGVTGSVSGLDAFDVGPNNVLTSEGEGALLAAKREAARIKEAGSAFDIDDLQELAADAAIQQEAQREETRFREIGSAFAIDNLRDLAADAAIERETGQGRANARLQRMLSVDATTGRFEDEVATRRDLQALGGFETELQRGSETGAFFDFRAARELARQEGTSVLSPAAQEQAAPTPGEELALQTDPLTTAVTDFETRFLGASVPGEGAIAQPVSDPSLLSDRGAVGNFVSDAEEAVGGEVDLFETAVLGAITPSEDSDAEVSPVSVGIVKTGFGIVESAILLGPRAAEFEAATISAVRQGKGDEFAESAEQAVINAPFLAAAGLIASARDKPVETAAGLAGSLAVTSGLIRAVPASKFVIQPGEEAAGIGGFAVTRRLSPRLAERAFPGTGTLNREPLLISEEAFAAGVRRTTGALSSTLKKDAAIISGRRALGPSPRQAELIERFRPEGTVPGRDPTLPDDRPDLLTSEMVNLRNADPKPSTADAEGMILFSGPIPVPIRRPRRRSRGEVLGGGASETIREEMVRQQIAQRRSFGGDFEGEFDPVGDAELQPGSELDFEVRSEFDAQAEFERTEFGPFDRVQPPGVRGGVDTLTRLGSDVDFEFETETETEQEPRSEFRPPRLRFDTPPAFDVRLTGDFEFDPSEPEQETEPELERPPTETEIEAELFSDRKRLRRSANPLAPLSSFEKRFSSGVASPSDVLSGLSKGVIDDS